MEHFRALRLTSFIFIFVSLSYITVSRTQGQSDATGDPCRSYREHHDCEHLKGSETAFQCKDYNAAQDASLARCKSRDKKSKMTKCCEE